MPRHIIYIVNPISGTSRKTQLKDLIGRRTREQGIAFEIVASRADGDYLFLHKMIREKDVTDVVICGGDGTVNGVVKALQGVKVNIGIVPMGSGNGLAFAAGIPKSPAKALDVIFAGTACPADAFTLNGHFSCMLCGIGFDAAVAHSFAAQKQRGLQTYVKVSMLEFIKAKPYAFEIKINGEWLKTDAFFICIANGNQFGNNVTIAPMALLGDGLLDIVIVKKMNKFMLPFSLLQQLTGSKAVQLFSEHSKSKNILYLQTDRLSIKNLSTAPLHIDGDPADTDERFDIRIIRNCFRLLQPDSAKK